MTNQEPTNVTLVLPGGGSVTIDVVDLGSEQYRVVDPVIGVCPEIGIGFNDVVAARPRGPGELVFERIVERASFRTFDFCLPNGWIELSGIKEVLKTVQELGGEWAGIFGGILLIVLPPGVEYDPTNDVLRTFR